MMETITHMLEKFYFTMHAAFQRFCSQNLAFSQGMEGSACL
jgi:hypothetical protein